VDHALRHRHPRRRAAALLAGLAAMLLATLTSPARAEDPTPMSKALTLATPGVVFVLVTADVSLTLDRAFFEQVREQVPGRRIDFSTPFTLPMSTGSGAAVAPDWVVTAGHVVQFDEEQEQQARTYAANRLFFGTLKASFGELSRGRSFTEQHLPDPARNSVLEACYDEDICRFDVKADVRVVTAVQVGGESSPKVLSARVQASRPFDGGDVAALQVIDADPLATVPMATSAVEVQSGQDVAALGFPGSHIAISRNGLTQPSASFGKVSSILSDGSGQVIQVDMKIESGMSGGAALDESGKVIGIISYTGLDENLNRTHAYLQTADNIRSVLREVGVQPLRGELDDAFAKAMDYYWSGHYSAALGLLRKVDDLQDGHPLARKYLRQAQTKAGGSDDIPVSTPSPTAPEGLDAAFWGLVALGILVAIALALLAIGWRRRQAASGPAYAPISPNGDGRPEGEVPENAHAGRTG
jgi:S1-C subfamily serine protease